MGEVFRANDTRLERAVAVKVLSRQLSASPDLRRRFEREARVISSLKHPHICALYDLGREGEIDYLVLELLEGESLAQRLARGALPLPKAIRVGIQIADALAAAHGAGIVHRDLKPGNVFLTPHGAKLLDFGLAKLHAPTPPVTDSAGDPMPMPTPISLTGEGVIVGTLQYMAPEQLEGKEADARSDLFALGALLYEMVTGARAFTGDSRAGLIGSILHQTPPPLSSRVPLAPPALERVIATCLEKDPAERWRSAHDIRVQLGWILNTGSPGAPGATLPHSGGGRRRLAWVAGVATIATALSAPLFLALSERTAPPVPQLSRFQVVPPESISSVGRPRLSPDGRYLAFVADGEGITRLWVRPIDALEARPLASTEGAISWFRPFWSPDSRFIGFVAGGRLKKVAAAGGPAQEICEAAAKPFNGTWSEDGTILFDGKGDPIRRVSASGGVVTSVVEPEEAPIGDPQFLPGGKKFLYREDFGGGRFGTRIANADGSGARQLLAGVWEAEYVSPDRILFVRDGWLYIQRLDLERGELLGEPVALSAAPVDQYGETGITVSRTGTLAYREDVNPRRGYAWADRNGRSRATLVEAQNARNFDLSSDARWLAFETLDAGAWSLRIVDLNSGVTSRVTAAAEPEPDRDGAATMEAQFEGCALFDHDGRRLLFGRGRGDRRFWIVSRSLQGGQQQLLHEHSNYLCPGALTPDGRTLLFDRRKGDAVYDIWRLDVDVPASATPLIVSPFSSSRPSLSPDGRWIAFQGDATGRTEIYVTPFADPQARRQISAGGGREPQWGPSGGELFYISAQNQLMRVPVQAGASFDAGSSEPLFTMNASSNRGRNRYLVAPDGERFLVPLEDSRSAFTVVLNWSRSLER